MPEINAACVFSCCGGVVKGVLRFLKDPNLFLRPSHLTSFGSFHVSEIVLLNTAMRGRGRDHAPVLLERVTIQTADAFWCCVWPCLCCDVAPLATVVQLIGVFSPQFMFLISHCAVLCVLHLKSYRGNGALASFLLAALRSGLAASSLAGRHMMNIFRVTVEALLRKTGR